MLLDEPFSALDALTRVSAQALVNELWQRHQPAVLLVTHDVEESLLLADRVADRSTTAASPTTSASTSSGRGAATTPTSCRAGGSCWSGSASSDLNPDR